MRLLFQHTVINLKCYCNYSTVDNYRLPFINLSVRGDYSDHPVCVCVCVCVCYRLISETKKMLSRQVFDASRLLPLCLLKLKKYLSFLPTQLTHIIKSTYNTYVYVLKYYYLQRRKNIHKVIIQPNSILVV